MMVLGWWLDTRKLLLRLPNNKFRAYSKEVEEILAAGTIDGKDLESIIGKFVHASYAIPLSQHYLDNLRFKLKSLKENNPHRSQLLSNNEVHHFILWQKILVKANEGVSLNGLVLCQPTRERPRS